MFPEPPDGAVDRSSAPCGNFFAISPGGGQLGERSGEAPRAARGLSSLLVPAVVVGRRRGLVPGAAVVAAGAAACIAERRRRDGACQQANCEEQSAYSLHLGHSPP